MICYVIYEDWSAPLMAILSSNDKYSPEEAIMAYAGNLKEVKCVFDQNAPKGEASANLTFPNSARKHTYAKKVPFKTA